MREKYTRMEAETDLRLLAEDEKAGLVRDWLETRPQVIRDLYAKYNPSQFYRVKKDAPYRFTGAGCIISIQSFFEDGSVRVRVLRDQDGHVGVDAALDPQWLEPVTLDEAFPLEAAN